MMRERDTSLGGHRELLQNTAWSVIRAAQAADPEARRQALEHLIRQYWKTVYFYIRRTNRTNEESKDLTQEFFTEILDGDVIDSLDEERGRFRGFLKVALRNFLRDEHRARVALKRGGSKGPISLDELARVAGDFPAAAHSPEETLDREWRRIQISDATGRLKERYQAKGKEHHYTLFEAYYLDDGSKQTHQEMAEKMGLTASQVNNYLTAARQKFRGILTQVVAESVNDEDSLREELTELFGEEYR